MSMMRKAVAAAWADAIRNYTVARTKREAAYIDRGHQFSHCVDEGSAGRAMMSLGAILTEELKNAQMM